MISLKDLTTHGAPSPAMCRNPNCICLLTEVDGHGKKTVLIYIFAKTIEKKEQGLDTSGTEEHF